VSRCASRVTICALSVALTIVLTATRTAAQTSVDAATTNAAVPPTALPALELSTPPAAPNAATTLCVNDPRYDAAFDRFADGDDAGAVQVLTELTVACPEHLRAFDLLRRIRERMARGLPSRARPPAPDPTPPEQPSGLAQAELIIGQAITGMGNGFWVCGWNNCGPAGIAGVAFVGAGVFGLAAAGLSTLGIRQGQAMAVNTGALWGGYIASMLALTANVFGTAPAPPGWITLSVPFGTAGGLVTGTLIAVYARPRSGQLSFVNSGALWGGAFGFGIAAAVSLVTLPATFGWSQLIGVTTGITATAIASAFYPVSRGRMFVVDLGTALGGLAGAGIAAIMTAAGASAAPAFGLTMTLMGAAGFGFTLAATHGVDARRPQTSPVPSLAPQSSLMPVGPNGIPGITWGATF